MFKWIMGILVAALIVGGLMLAGIIQVAVGVAKLVFFAAVGLIVVAIIAGWLLKKAAT